MGLTDEKETSNRDLSSERTVRYHVVHSGIIANSMPTRNQQSLGGVLSNTSRVSS